MLWPKTCKHKMNSNLQRDKMKIVDRDREMREMVQFMAQVKNIFHPSQVQFRLTVLSNTLTSWSLVTDTPNNESESPPTRTLETSKPSQLKRLTRKFQIKLPLRINNLKSLKKCSSQMTTTKNWSNSNKKLLKCPMSHLRVDTPPRTKATRTYLKVKQELIQTRQLVSPRSHLLKTSYLQSKAKRKTPKAMFSQP